MSDSPSDPQHATIVAALSRIEERLDRLESRLDTVAQVNDEVPALIGVATDTFDSTVARLAARGVDVDARLRRLLELLERSTAPQALGSLEAALDVAESAPGTVGMVADTFDGMIARLAADGIDVDERLRVLVHVAERLTAPEALDAVRKVLANIESLHALLDSGVLEESAVAMVGRAAGALAEMRHEDIRPVGLFGLVRSAGDPEIQRSIGALIEFGRLFGKASHGSDGVARTH